MALRGVGFYHRQVEAYMKEFTRARVILFDDFVRNPEWCLRDTFDFLGVDSTVVPETERRINVSSIPKAGIMKRASD